MGPGVPLNIVFIVPYAPTRIRTRPFHFIRSLAASGHRVTVATLWCNEEERAAVEALRDCVAEVVAQRLSVYRSAWNCVQALGTAEPLQARYSWSASFAKRIARIVHDEAVDVVHVEHLRGARYGLGVMSAVSQTTSPRPALVWDSVDCITSLFRRAARESRTLRVRVVARLELARTSAFERTVAPQFDRVLVTSAIDRRELLALGAGRAGAVAPERVEVVPNGVDLDYFSPSALPREPATLVVTGKMSYHANATAVARFVRDVMPAVWHTRPDTNVWIVGKDPTPEVTALGRRGNPLLIDDVRTRGSDRVWITGTVEDLRPFLWRATAAVAPIQYGVGIQNKVLEAMACGTPVVATAEAVSALGVRCGHEVLIADNLSAMAPAILRVLGEPDERRRLGAAGRRFVERHHNWRSLAGQLATIYRDARVS